jgi:hypothetical protein
MATRLIDLGLPPPGPTTTPTEDGGVVVDFSTGEPIEAQPAPIAHGTNLCTVLPEQVVSDLYSTLVDAVEDDASTKTDWEETARKALDLLGLKILDNKPAESKDGISQATDTLLLETTLMWQATALAETMPLSGPAKAALGITPPPGAPPQATAELQAGVQRAEDYINCLLTKEDKTYVPRHDRMLFDVGLLGAGFKKVYADPTSPTGITIDLVRPEDLIVSYHADDLSRGRVTHRIRLSEDRMQQLVAAGVYIDAPRKAEPQQASSIVEEKRDEAIGQSPGTVEDDSEYLAYEVHCDLVLQGDESPAGTTRPYVVTLDTTTETVRAIYRNWREGDQRETRRVAFANYGLLPAKSLVFCYGLAHLIGNAANSSSDILRRLLDAGLLANHPAGFKLNNLGIREESRPHDVGEFRDIDSPTGDVRAAFAALPFAGPSPALVELFEKVRDNGRRVAGQAQLNISETLTSNTPVGTALAALDEAGRIPGSIQRRIWHSLDNELELIRQTLLDVLPPGQPVPYGDGKMIDRRDLEIARFEPAMRPGSPTKTHRVAEAQAVLQLVTQFPQQHNVKAALQFAYGAFGIHEPEQFLAPEPGQAQPSDPVTEMTNALAGKPLAVGWTQDHDSHIQAHALQMQMLALDPSLGDAAASASGALQAHIAEHFSKRVAVQTAMAIGLPLEMFAQGQGIPPQLETQIAPQVAAAMQQILAQMPKPPDPANTQLQIAQLKEQGANERDQRKAATTLAVQRMKDATEDDKIAADTAQNNADNSTALAIAGLREMSRPDTQPSAPSNDRNPGGGF